FGISHRDPPAQAIQLQSIASKISALLCQIDAVHLGATARKLKQVGSEPASDLDNLFSSPLIEAHHLAHEVVALIALAFNFFEECQGPFFNSSRVDRAAGRCFPELFYLFL